MSNTPNVVVILATFPSGPAARDFAHAALNQRLAACVSLVPGVQSMYLWQGALQEATEHLALIKTTTTCRDALLALLTAMHAYEVPEGLVLPCLDGLPAYVAWVNACCAPEVTPPTVPPAK